MERGPAGSFATSTHPDYTPPPRNALQALRIRETPDGARTISRIQYDPPYFRSEDDAGVQIVDMEQHTLHLQTPDGRRLGIDLTALDLAPQCAFFFNEFDPRRHGAVVVGETVMGNATCTVLEIPKDQNFAGKARATTGNPPLASSAAKDDTMGPAAASCPNLSGVRMTICPDTPLPVRVELPGGVVERLESWTLLPAGSLREAMGAVIAADMRPGVGYPARTGLK